MKGLWEQKDVPHKGWLEVEEYDRGIVNAELCEMCRAFPVRYVHVMRHRDYPLALNVGCGCAEKMKEQYRGDE